LSSKKSKDYFLVWQAGRSKRKPPIEAQTSPPPKRGPLIEKRKVEKRENARRDLLARYDCGLKVAGWNFVVEVSSSERTPVICSS
jgi:hypothetical protein